MPSTKKKWSNAKPIENRKKTAAINNTEYDIATVHLLQTQDQASFKMVVMANQNRVYNTILHFVNQREEAEDLAQEVFLKAYAALPTFKAQCKVSTWLYRFAVNVSLDFLRAQKRQKRQGLLVRLFQKETDDATWELPDLVHPGITLENKERAQVLHAAVAKLPEKQRVAFQLNNFDGLSYAEVADIMEMSKSAIESLLFRAKDNLRKSLQSFYEQNM